MVIKPFPFSIKTMFPLFSCSNFHLCFQISKSKINQNNKNTYISTVFNKLLGVVSLRIKTSSYISVWYIRSCSNIWFIPRFFILRRINFLSIFSWSNGIIYIYWVNKIPWSNSQIPKITWGSISSRTRCLKSSCPLCLPFLASKTISFYWIELTYIMNWLTSISNLFMISWTRLRIKFISRWLKFFVLTPNSRFSPCHFTRDIFTCWRQRLLIFICSCSWYISLLSN